MVIKSCTKPGSGHPDFLVGPGGETYVARRGHCPECCRERDRRYRASPKGKASRERWNKTEKARESKRAWHKTPSGRARTASRNVARVYASGIYLGRMSLTNQEREELLRHGKAD